MKVNVFSCQLVTINSCSSSYFLQLYSSLSGLQNKYAMNSVRTFHRILAIFSSTNLNLRAFVIMPNYCALSADSEAENKSFSRLFLFVF